MGVPGLENKTFRKNNHEIRKKWKALITASSMIAFPSIAAANPIEIDTAGVFENSAYISVLNGPAVRITADDVVFVNTLDGRLELINNGNAVTANALNATTIINDGAIDGGSISVVDVLNSFATNTGSIITPTNGIDVFGGESTHIVNTGSISAADRHDAISVLFTSVVTIENQGSLFADGDVVFVGGHDSLNLSNSGFISGNFGGLSLVSGDQTTVVNDGSIVTGLTAVLGSETQAFTLENNGLLQSLNLGSAAIIFDGVADVAFTNSGNVNGVDFGLLHNGGLQLDPNAVSSETISNNVQWLLAEGSLPQSGYLNLGTITGATAVQINDVLGRVVLSNEGELTGSELGLGVDSVGTDIIASNFGLISGASGVVLAGGVDFDPGVNHLIGHVLSGDFADQGLDFQALQDLGVFSTSILAFFNEDGGVISSQGGSAIAVHADYNLQELLADSDPNGVAAFLNGNLPRILTIVENEVGGVIEVSNGFGAAGIEVIGNGLTPVESGLVFSDVPFTGFIRNSGDINVNGFNSAGIHVEDVVNTGISNNDTILASGISTEGVSVQSSFGISVTNNGLIDVGPADSSPGGDGIQLVSSSDALIRNEAIGSISTASDGANAVFSVQSFDVTIENLGVLRTDGFDSHGIEVFGGDRIDIQNDGLILVEGDLTNGILISDVTDFSLSQGFDTLVVRGVRTNGTAGHGISILGTADIGVTDTINTTAPIVTYGNYSNAINIAASPSNTSGVYSDVTVFNGGFILTNGINSHGIALGQYISDQNSDGVLDEDELVPIQTSVQAAQIQSFARIETHGANSHGIFLSAANELTTGLNTVDNFGSITVTGERSNGIRVENSQNLIVNNSGARISAQGEGGVGIWVEGTANTITNQIGAEVSALGLDGSGIIVNSAVGSENIIDNDGLIQASQFAVFGGAGVERLNNNGVIVGDIQLGAGNDAINHDISGAILGDIDGGEGFDFLGISGLPSSATTVFQNISSIETIFVNTGGAYSFGDVSDAAFFIRPNTTTTVLEGNFSSSGFAVAMDSQLQLVNTELRQGGISLFAGAFVEFGLGSSLIVDDANFATVLLLEDYSHFVNRGHIQKFAGVIQAVSVDAAVDAEGVNSAIIENFGVISSNALAIKLEDVNDTVVTNSGTISLTDMGSVGVRAGIVVRDSSGLQITNHGDITTAGAQGYGIYTLGGSSGNERAQIQNTGVIYTLGSQSHAVNIQSAPELSFSNTGQIQTDGDRASAALFVDVDQAQISNNGILRATGASGALLPSQAAAGLLIEGSDSAIITNEERGVIEGVGAGGLGVFFNSIAGEVNSLINHGVVRGTDVAVLADAGDEFIENFALIEGDVSLGAGNDVVVNNGAIEGNVDLGAGDDAFHQILEANTTGTVDGGDGIDLLNVTVSSQEGVIGSNNRQFVNFEQFAKSGKGTYDITTDMTMTDVQVDDGLLKVNSTVTAPITVNESGSLGGSGLIRGTVYVSGGLNAGNSPGILTIDGDLTLDMNSLFTVEYNRGAFDQVVVTGTALLEGGNLEIVPLGDNIFGDFSLEVLNAGTLIGTFGQLDAPSFLTVVERYEGNSLFLDISTAIGNGVVLDGQSQRTATYLNAVLPMSTDADVLALGRTVAFTDGTQLNSALDDLHPESYAATSSLSATSSLGVVDALRDQLVVGRGAEKGHIDLWVSGLADFGDQDGQGATSGFDTDSYGVVAGLTYGLSDGISVGALVGYQNLEQDFDGIRAETDADNVFVGAYATANFAKFNVDAAFIYHTADVETTRSVTVLNDSVFGDYDVDALTLSGRVGYEAFANDGWLIEPYAGLTYINSDRDDVTEVGAQGANLFVSGEETDFTFLDLGTRIVGQWADGKITPYVDLAWRYDLSNDGNGATARFINESATFRVQGADVERSRAHVGAGLTGHITDKLKAYVTYGGDFGSDLTNHAVRTGVRYSF